ncbi:hypothetical protein LINGRAHAP2_LOCUS15226 [Linum grandiflorum]
MSKLKRSGSSFDEFGYEDQPVLCNCGLRASRRISHTSQNPNRKFFGFSNYKSKVREWFGLFAYLDNSITIYEWYCEWFGNV